MIKENNIEKLCEKRAELATMLTKAMESRKLNSLETSAGNIEYDYHPCNNGGYHTLSFDDSNDLDSDIGEEGDGRYMYGDFNHFVSRPSPAQVVNFIEAWDEIVAAFSEYDAEIAKVCEKEFAKI